MKTILLFLSVFSSVSLFGQNVFIPDANFKAYLVGISSINTNGDTEIQFSEASNYSANIICSGLNISDLTGIEAFININYLNCQGNQLTSLDVSQNTSLWSLICPGNQLTSLDMFLHPSIYELDCRHNQLTCLNMAIESTEFDFLSTTDNPNLDCIEVWPDWDPGWSSQTPDSWFSVSIDPQTSFSENCNNDCTSTSVGISELSTSKNLIQTLDMMGRETSFKHNTPLIYVYDDGSIEKVFTIE